MLSKEETKIVIDKLLERFPDAKAELDFTNNFELLIATILSAQCTDVQVNKTTKVLFQELKEPEDYIKLSVDELGQKIRSCGFYKTKSTNILETCKLLLENYNGQVPSTMDDLTSLPGVGRKTANVMQSVAFNKAAMAVDTHVFRVSHRIGLVPDSCTTPLATEKYLMKYMPEEILSKAHHWLILHGRYVCIARSPKCSECGLNGLCKFSLKPKIK